MVHLHFLLVGFFSWLLMHSETSHNTTAPVPINCNINIQLVLSNKSKLLMFHNNVIYIIKTSDHHKSLPYTYTQLTDQSSNHVTWLITGLNLPAKCINNSYTSSLVSFSDTFCAPQFYILQLELPAHGKSLWRGKTFVVREKMVTCRKPYSSMLAYSHIAKWQDHA